MGDATRLAVVALQFCTRVPLPAVAWSPDDLRRASAGFPLVGALLAAVAVAVRAALEPLWGPTTATLGAVAALVALTGALHEDGLADSADGLWAGADASQRLAIMRDSRLGTYGTVAVVTVLGLRTALLSPLDLAGFARALLAGHVLGRAAVLVLASRLPPVAGSSSGAVAGQLTPLGALLAVGSVTAAAVVAAGWWSPLLVLLCLGVTIACGALFRRRLGGVTGDALGAAVVVVEVAAIAIVAAIDGGKAGP